MAEHTVKFSAPSDLELPKVDMVFRVWRGDQALGKLRVSRGGVEWMQRDDKKKAYHMSWERLDGIFVAQGNKGITRSSKRKK